MAGKISLRKIWAVARTEWLKWVCNPRMIIIPVLTVFIYSYAITPLLERSEKMGEPLNLLEPLIAVGNSGMLTLIIPLVFLTLMSDFPKTDGSSLFFLSRTGRYNWLLGQILFGVMSALTFLAAIYVICTAFLMNRAFLADGWSMVVKRYDLLFPEEAVGFASELVPPNLYNQMTPFSAAIQTFVLLSCNGTACNASFRAEKPQGCGLSCGKRNNRLRRAFYLDKNGGDVGFSYGECDSVAAFHRALP